MHQSNCIAKKTSCAIGVKVIRKEQKEAMGLKKKTSSHIAHLMRPLRAGIVWNLCSLTLLASFRPMRVASIRANVALAQAANHFTQVSWLMILVDVVAADHLADDDQ